MKSGTHALSVFSTSVRMRATDGARCGKAFAMTRKRSSSRVYVVSNGVDVFAHVWMYRRQSVVSAGAMRWTTRGAMTRSLALSGAAGMYSMVVASELIS